MAEIVQNLWLWISEADLRTELRQLEEEGRDVTALRRTFRRMIRRGDAWLWEPRNQRKAEALLDEAASAPMRKDYPFDEPSDLAGIRRRRGPGVRAYPKRLSDRIVGDRIAGAWLGRCVGCFLGKAAEGVRSDRFRPFLEATGQWPIRDYLRFGRRGKVAEAFPDLVRRNQCDTLEFMPVDDDTNYTAAGVMIVREHGAGFTPADVARFWMDNLPLLSTCTAERVAYRNFALQIQPPASATHRNPYREWIGAQIRADGLAYTVVGRPELAAEFAWRDASISHVKNGIYGEMFVAAMIAAAPYEKDVRSVIEAGLAEIPRTSRLHEAVSEALRWPAEGLGYDDAVARIHRRWDEHDPHDWCHTIPNAVICATAMLYADGDFGLGVCRAVQACFDTDCNGATVGSVLGMMRGAGGIDQRWSARLNDTLRTTLRGYETVSISRIAADTFGLYKRLA